MVAVVTISSSLVYLSILGCYILLPVVFVEVVKTVIFKHNLYVLLEAQSLEAQVQVQSH